MSWTERNAKKVERVEAKITGATITASTGRGRQSFRVRGNREQVKEQVDNYKELGYTRVEVRYSDGSRDRF